MPLKRRALLAAAGAAIAGRARAEPGVRLRILATSDIGAAVADWDYNQARPDLAIGLAKTATLIGQARAEAQNCLLFDNGGALEGGALADYLARSDAPAPDRQHPVLRAMGRIGYDAAQLGGQELVHGLPALDRALAGARFPVVCANMERLDGGAAFPPSAVLDRTVVDEDGEQHKVRIGVIGFLDPQSLLGNDALRGAVRVTDIVESAREHLPALRSQCDVLVALCHADAASSLDTALRLAAVPGVDAIVGGAARQVFPGAPVSMPGADAVQGTLHGVPAVLPGAFGSHLGVIDLDLVAENRRWSVQARATRAWPIYRRVDGRLVSLAPAAREVITAIQPEHGAAMAWMNQAAGRLGAPIHTDFAAVGDTDAVAMVNAAQLWYAKPLLAATPHATLPLLSAAAPSKAGEQGPEAFVDIPAGAIMRRHVAELCGRPAPLCCVRMTGAELAGWLEHAASAFRTIDPAVHGPQPLLDPQAGLGGFDVISGLVWTVDVSRPVGSRVRDLRFRAAPVDPDQAFIVVTTAARAAGVGGVPGLDGSRTVLTLPDPNHEAVMKFLASEREITLPERPSWRLRTGAPAEISFRSAQSARNRLNERPGVRWIEDGGDGYATFALSLS